MPQRRRRRRKLLWLLGVVLPPPLLLAADALTARRVQAAAVDGVAIGIDQPYRIGNFFAQRH